MGGYPAGGGDRDPDANDTIVDGADAGSVVVIDTKDYVTIDGFTIINGSATYGGGICCYVSSSPTLANCTISGNTGEYGGGIYCDNSSAELKNCTVSGNTADTGGEI